MIEMELYCPKSDRSVQIGTLVSKIGHKCPNRILVSSRACFLATENLCLVENTRFNLLHIFNFFEFRCIRHNLIYIFVTDFDYQLFLVTVFRLFF